MAFPRSPASTVSSYASTPTLSSCPSSSISTGCSTPATPNPFAVAAISPAGIRYIVPAGRACDHKPALASTGTPEFTQGKKLQQHQDHKPALAATGTPEFTQGQKLQQHQDLPESAAKFPEQENPAPATIGSTEFLQGKKLQQHQDLLESAANFPKQEINGWEHPDLCSPSKLLKNVSTSIKEISRWARSSTGSKVNSNNRLLESVFSLIQVVTSTAPHPDHVVAMNIFPFLLQHFAQFVDELCPKRGVSLSERFGNALHDLRRSIRSGLQVLEYMILDYTSDVAPQGGGIHEITKYLLKYITSLLDNGTSLKIILVGDEQDGKVAMETLQDIVATLISHLEIMLEKESHRYKDAGLKQMFMVNNVNFLLYQVEGSGIGYLLGDDWVLKHRDQLKEHVSSFINISWESVMYCFHVKTSKIPIFSSLQTLQIFNLENHKNKAPKLMKYTPEDLEELLSDLFEG